MKQIQFIGLSPEELQETIVKGVKAQIDDLKQFYQPKEPTEFLSRKEVSKLLKIDLSTLHNWVKSKKLNAYSCGGRVYFKRSEIEKSIIKIN